VRVVGERGATRDKARIVAEIVSERRVCLCRSSTARTFAAAVVWLAPGIASVPGLRFRVLRKLQFVSGSPGRDTVFPVRPSSTQMPRPPG